MLRLQQRKKALRRAPVDERRHGISLLCECSAQGALVWRAIGCSLAGLTRIGFMRARLCGDARETHLIHARLALRRRERNAALVWRCLRDGWIRFPRRAPYTKAQVVVIVCLQFGLNCDRSLATALCIAQILWGSG